MRTRSPRLLRRSRDPHDGRWRALTCVWRRGEVAVWRGEHVASGQAVALKTLANDDPGRALHHEAWAAAGLSHPHLHPVLDLAQVALPDDPRRKVWCLVTPWASLGSAQRMLGCATVGHVHALVEDVLAGLIHAHGRGIVHRDLKLGNLLLWGTSKAWRVRVADFGVAHAVSASEPHRDDTQRIEGAWGTPGWMAPEQQDPDGPIGPWTDIYGLGRIVETLLAPTQTAQSDPRALAERNAWVQRALAADPGHRFPTAAHALAAWPTRTDGNGRPALTARVSELGGHPPSQMAVETTRVVRTPIPVLGSTTHPLPPRPTSDPSLGAWHLPPAPGLLPLDTNRLAALLLGDPTDLGPDPQWGPDLLRWRATPVATDAATTRALWSAIQTTLQPGVAHTLRLEGADLVARVAAVQSVGDALAAAGTLLVQAGENPDDSWVEDLARLVAGALGLPPRANASARCLPALLARLHQAAHHAARLRAGQGDIAAGPQDLGQVADSLLLAQLQRLLDGAGWWRSAGAGPTVTRDAVFRDRSESVWATVRVLQLAAQVQPVVLVLHEADVRGDLAGLAQGVAYTTWSQGLVVVRAQAAPSASATSEGTPTVVVPAPEHHAIAAALARVAPLRDTACREVSRIAGGDLATAMRGLRDAADEGGLQAVAAGWTLDTGWWEAHRGPAAIWNHARARCVGTDRATAALLRALLPLGTSFLHVERAAIAHATHCDDAPVRPGGTVWTALVRAGLWTPSHDGVRWDHRAHAAAWETLSPTTQRRLARQALAVCGVPDETADPVVATRALALAVRADARQHLPPRAQQAARAWLRLGAPHTALECLTQASTPNGRVPHALSLQRATALHAAGRTQEALTVATSLVKRVHRAHPADRARLRAETLRVVAVCALTLGKLAQADAACQAMREHVAAYSHAQTPATPHPAIQDELWLLEAVLASVTRRWTPVVVDQLASLADQTQTRPYAAARASLLLAEAHLHAQDTVAAMTATQRTLDVGRAHGLGALVIQALNMQGEIARRAGDIRGAYDAFQQALQCSDPRAGLAGYLRYNLAAAGLALDRTPEAIHLLDATTAPAGSRLWLFVELARVSAATKVRDLTTVQTRWPAIYAVLCETALRDDEYVAWCTSLASALASLAPQYAAQAAAAAERLQLG